RNPAQRYLSARALASDIEHWLADDPVAAHREPLAQRTGRWLRRHAAAARAAAIALVVVAVALSASLVLVDSARRQTDKALANETAAKNEEIQQRQIADAAKKKAEQAEAETLADYRASTDDA